MPLIRLTSPRTPAGGASHISSLLESVSPVLVFDAWYLLP